MRGEEKSIGMGDGPNKTPPESRYKPTSKDRAQDFWNRKSKTADEITNPAFSPGMLEKPDRWAIKGKVTQILCQEELSSKLKGLVFKVKYKVDPQEILAQTDEILKEQYVDPAPDDPKKPRSNLANNKGYMQAINEAAILLLKTNRHGELNKQLPRFTGDNKDVGSGLGIGTYEYAISNAGLPKAFMSVVRARRSATV